MEKKDYVFVSLLAVCFLVSAVFLAGSRLEKRMEQLHSETIDSHTTAELPKLPIIPERFPREEKDPEMEEAPEPELAPPLEPEGPRPFMTVGYEYFDDALLVGDSRMEGILEYGNLEKATFFADAGMSVFSLGKKRLPVGDEGKLTFEEVLNKKQYGKVYLMLGLNELGYKESAIIEKYGETVEQILASQEEAILFLCANMHVTEKQSGKDKVFNNDNINRVNEMISRFADGQRIIYLDVNEAFDDENGNLKSECSSDGFHVYAKHYVEWVDWLCTKGI